MFTSDNARTNMTTNTQPATMSETNLVIALSPGGRGGDPITLDLSKSRDLRMVKKALQERWDVPADVRPALAAAVADIATGDRFSARHRRTAVGTLVLMMQRNIEAEAAALALESVPAPRNSAQFGA